MVGLEAPQTKSHSRLALPCANLLDVDPVAGCRERRYRAVERRLRRVDVGVHGCEVGGECGFYELHQLWTREHCGVAAAEQPDALPDVECRRRMDAPRLTATRADLPRHDQRRRRPL